jgi:hypothetical protein
MAALRRFSRSRNAAMGYSEQIGRDNIIERRRVSRLPRWRKWGVLALLFAAGIALWLVRFWPH